ncbi:MAG: hypothetical protein O3A01_08570 [bacterium]|jgi:hypothetical protein|nr:hypothetical protein [bacterium]
MATQIASFFKIIFALTLSLILVSCSEPETQQDRLASASASCSSYGFKAGSENFAACVQKQVISDQEQKAARNARISAALGRMSTQYNSNLYGGSGSTTGSSYGSGTTCFKKSDYTSGFNKICNYSCLGSAYATTIGSTQLCPLTVTR